MSAQTRRHCERSEAIPFLKRHCFVVALLFFAMTTLAFAQGAVSARLWPKEARIGDEIKLIIDVDPPSGYKFEPISDNLSLLPFELRRVEMVGTRRAVLTLSIFQTGEFQVPPITINFADASNRRMVQETPSLNIKITGVTKKASDKDDIRPIKGPAYISARSFWNLCFAWAAGILTLVLGVKLFLRLRAKRVLDRESLLAPHERVYLELDRLRKKNWLDEGRSKEFYSELADILRRYLERRFKIEAMELTTPELMLVLKDQPIDRLISESLKDLMEKADLVKFAQYQPPRIWATQLPEILCKIVDATKVETVTK